MRTRRPLLFVLFSIVLAVAVCAFAVAARKAMSSHGSEDYATLYSAARAWRTGVSPYSIPVLEHVWATSGGPTGMGPNNYFELSLYPPSTLVALSPWSVLDWNAARDAWAVTNVLLVLGALVSIVDLAGIPLNDCRAVALLATTLLLGSFRHTVSFGQPAAPACAAIIIAAAFAHRRHDLAAAIFLAIALAIKVQIAGPFLAYYFCRRRWKLSLVCLGLVASLMLVGILRMRVAGFSWVADWQNNIRIVGAPGGINDYSPTGPWRFQLVNLQVILTSLMSGSLANILTLLIVGITTAWVLLTTWTRRGDVTRQTELVELSLMAALALLVVYHRWYDTGALAFCLAWAAAVWTNRSGAPDVHPGLQRLNRFAIFSVLLVAPFFASLAIKLRPEVHLQRLSATEFVPATASPRGPWWMELFVLPNQVWALILIVALMLYVRGKTQRPTVFA